MALDGMPDQLVPDSLTLLRTLAEHDQGDGVRFDLLPSKQWRMTGSDYTVDSETFQALDRWGLIDVGSGDDSPVKVTAKGREFLEAPTPEELADQMGVRNLRAKNGGAAVELVPPEELARHIFANFAHMIGDAMNYVEFELQHPTTGWRCVFIVQRVGPDKLTPHDARAQAERRAEQAEAEAARLRAELGALHVPLTGVAEVLKQVEHGVRATGFRPGRGDGPLVNRVFWPYREGGAAENAEKVREWQKGRDITPDAVPVARDRITLVGNWTLTTPKDNEQ
ncbi:hypothetical protein ACQP25_44545 (plasmid) [Microtetraspora malaysiensis]|uniref:hypothetical protein n=1 Tax=Microtetraspora malaysiensis TaxID=161358 RepID=UPI003D8D072E